MQTFDTINIQCSAADTLPLDAIEDFQGGLKKRSKKDIELLVKSIEKYGFTFPFFIWQHEGRNLCLDGHGRIQALTEMRRRGFSLPRFPVVYVNASNEEEAKNKLLRLNSQYGKMTIDSVLEFTEGINVNFDELMLHGDSLKINNRVTEDNVKVNEPPALQKEVVSKYGEIYELGPHRLMCGDSADIDQVLTLMDGVKADMVFTDPPYGVGVVGKTKEALKIMNDDVTLEVLKEYVKKWFDCVDMVLREGSYLLATVPADPQVIVFMLDWSNRGWFRQSLVWNKSRMVFGHSEYHYKHELILFGWKGKVGKIKNQDRTKTSVWDFDKPQANRDHPTMKPVEMWEYGIRNHTEPGDILFEPFGGSGTTLIAAAKTGRIVKMMELDPRYCDVIRRRWTMWARENGHDVGSGGLEIIDA